MRCGSVTTKRSRKAASGSAASSASAWLRSVTGRPLPGTRAPPPTPSGADPGARNGRPRGARAALPRRPPGAVAEPAVLQIPRSPAVRGQIAAEVVHQVAVVAHPPEAPVKEDGDADRRAVRLEQLPDL